MIQCCALYHKPHLVQCMYIGCRPLGSSCLHSFVGFGSSKCNTPLAVNLNIQYIHTKPDASD